LCSPLAKEISSFEVLIRSFYLIKIVVLKINRSINWAKLYAARSLIFIQISKKLVVVQNSSEYNTGLVFMNI
jgi:hypothetical protein